MNQKRLHPKDAYKDSVVVSFFICLLILVGFLQTSDQFLHWFVIPVTLSGILIGIDAIDLLRGRLNIFDSVGILGLFGFHFFFLAPLLHVSWDSWLEPWYTPPPDWRPWLGNMAILNFLGLWVYRLSRNPGPKPAKNRSVQTVWRFDRQRFLPILCFALILSAVLQILVYKRFGGLIGYITAATEEGSDQFQGTSLIFLFSESFPILAMIGFAAYAQKNKRMRTWSVLLVVLIIFLVLQMLFGGLRGSRSNTVWALFWALGIIHFWIRPVSKREISLGLVFLVFFMYIYGFFKAGGLEGVRTALEGVEARANLEEKSGRTWEGLLLGDLGRSDIQAFLLYRLMRHDSDYEYAWGRTYLAAATILIPKSIWPERPPSKSKEGTNAMSGLGSYAPEIWVSSKVYGLAGEAMLNFGPFVVPFTFIILGVVVGRVQRCLLTWDSSDTRLLLLPMLVNFCFVILVSDADNNIFFLIKNGGFPCLVIWMVSKKISQDLPEKTSIFIDKSLPK